MAWAHLQADTLTDSSWYSPHYDRLLWRTWEDELFLFNPRTGHTHVLNQLSGEILAICAREPISSDDLAARLTELAGETVDPQMLPGHLSQLEQLGLVTVVTPT